MGKMCSRFSLVTELQELRKRFQIPESILHESSSESTLSLQNYNIAPGQFVYAIFGEQPYLRQVSWGIPFPVKVTSKQHGDSRRNVKQVINLRAETLLSKPFFARLLEKHRCIVPCNGFFEWARSGSVHQPFYFKRKNNTLMGLAGVCYYISDLHSNGFMSLVTVPAPESFAFIHDRFPLVLQPNIENIWLNPNTSMHELQVILHESTLPDLEYYMVSELVNNVNVNSFDVIKPLRSQSSLDDFF